jgi:guanylate kinase
MEGILLVLTGPAGSGKDALTEELGKNSRFRKFPSVTTRPIRPGESQRQPYVFLSDAEYDTLRDRGELLNDVVVGGFRYGIPRQALEEAYAKNEQLVLHLTREWALQVRELFPNTVLVLLKPPSRSEQIRRLQSRGATQGEVTRRLADVDVQSPPEEGFDLVLVNETDRLDETLSHLWAFMETQLGINGTRRPMRAELGCVLD